MLTIPAAKGRIHPRAAACAVILRAAVGLFLLALRRPFAPARITRDGRVMLR